MSTNNTTKFEVAMKSAIKKAIEEFRSDGTVAVSVGVLQSRISRALISEPSAPKGTNAARVFFDMMQDVIASDKKISAFVI